MRSPFHTTIGQFSSAAGRTLTRAVNVRHVEPADELPGSERGNLYMLVELLGSEGANAALYRQLLNTAQTAFYEAEGSLPAALVRALRGAHLALRSLNETLPPEAQWRAGMTCAAMRGNELLIAQAGPALTLVAHPRTIDQFPGGPNEFTPPLGGDERPEAEPFRTVVEPGSLILIGHSRWLQQAEPRTLAAVASVDDVNQVLDYLEQLSGDAELSALIVQIDSAAARPERPPASVPQPARSDPHPPPATAPLAGWGPVRARPQAPAPKQEEPVAPQPETVEPAETAAPPPLRRRPLASIPAAVAQPVEPAPAPPPTEERPPAHVRPVGDGDLPDEERPRRSAWPLILALVVIPLLIAALVFGMWFFRNQASETEFARLLSGASDAVAETQTLNDEGLVRQRLGMAREYLDQARAMRAEDPRLADVQAKYDQGIDRLNKVTPLYGVVPLWEWKGTGQRLERVVASSTSLFVLDRGLQQINLFTLSKLGDSVTPAETPVVISRSLTVQDTVVGDLVDIAWLDAVTNQRSKLLALDASGSLVGYDAQWGVVKVALASRETWGYAQAIATYNGNLYVVDTKANQIWRYTPTENGYENNPDPFFAQGKGPDLAGVQSIAIDGSIWLLYADGRLLKFYRGEQQEFAISGFADSLNGASTIVAQATGDRIYIADGGSGRIIEFNKDGKFQRQFKPSQDSNQFKGMRHLFLDEADSTFYVVAGNKVFKADLPRPDAAPTPTSK